MNEIVDRYIQAWNAAEPADRATLLAGSVAEGVRYVDPLADVTGADALGALIGAVQQQFAGLPLTLVGPVDAHHDVVRFSWALGPAGADPLVIGTDSVVLADDGRFALITGYLDKVPA